jgi:hypothetical protein
MNTIPFVDDKPRFKSTTLLNLKFFESALLSIFWFFSVGEIGREPQPDLLTALLTVGLLLGVIWVGVSNRANIWIENFFRKACQWCISSGLGLTLGWLLFLQYSAFTLLDFVASSSLYLLFATAFYKAPEMLYIMRIQGVNFNPRANTIVTLILAFLVLAFGWSFIDSSLTWLLTLTHKL